MEELEETASIIYFIDYAFKRIKYFLCKSKMENTTHYIKFRITKWTDIDKFIKFIHQYDKTFMVSENENSNHHYQGLIVSKTKKPCKSKSIVDAFRKKLKINQDLQGNKDFSVGEISETPEIYLRYLCKGAGPKTEPSVVTNNILLDNEVTLNHHKYWEENAKIKDHTSNRKYDKIRDYQLDEKYSSRPAEVQWAMKIILYHDENNLLIPDDYQIKKMVTTYIIKDCKNKDEIALRMANILYHQD